MFIINRFTIFFVLTITICLIFSKTTMANQSCIDNYSELGNWDTGKNFRSWIEFTDKDENRAFQTIGRKFATEGYLGLTTNKDIGVITAYQENRGRRSALTATFSKNTNGAIRVEISFQLASGLRVTTAAAREELCKLLNAAVPTNQQSDAASQNFSGISLQLASKNLPLSATIGKLRKAGFGPVIFFFYDFTGAKAGSRTTIKQPKLVIHSSTDPLKNYLLVRFDSNITDDSRSLKMGSTNKIMKAGVTGKGKLQPDEDWTIPFSTSEATSGSGIWILTPQSSLASGEYGLWDVEGYGVATFGVD